MISFEDCIALCGLTEEEVAAVAEHEHVPEIAAATLARYLLDQTRGPEEIRNMIVDDIRAALQAKQATACGRIGFGVAAFPSGTSPWAVTHRSREPQLRLREIKAGTPPSSKAIHIPGGSRWN